MSNDASDNHRKDELQAERDSAMRQVRDLRSNLRMIGRDLAAKGDDLVEQDAVDLVCIARELERTALRLRTIAVELNSANTLVGVKVAESIREGMVRETIL